MTMLNLNAFNVTIYVLVWYIIVGGSLYITTLYCAYGHPTFQAIPYDKKFSGIKTFVVFVNSLMTMKFS